MPAATSVIWLRAGLGTVLCAGGFDASCRRGMASTWRVEVVLVACPSWNLMPALHYRRWPNSDLLLRGQGSSLT